MIRLILIASLLIIAGANVLQEKPREDKDVLSQAQEAKIDDLTLHPDRYDESIVRVRGLWVSQYHGDLLCPLDSDANCVGADLECPSDEACKVMQDILKTSLEGELWNMRAGFIVVGRFKDLKKPPSNHPRFILKVLKIEGCVSEGCSVTVSLTTLGRRRLLHYIREPLS